MVTLGGGKALALTLAEAQQNVRQREAALRVAEERHAAGLIPYRNVEDRQRELAEARATLAEIEKSGSSGSNSGGSSGGSSGGNTSGNQASSDDIAALEQQVKQRQAALRVAEERHAAGLIPYRNVQDRQRELAEAEAALAAAKNGSGGSSGGSGGSNNPPSSGQDDDPGSGSGGNSAHVSNAGQLASALATAAPGSRIILANGSYSRSGGFTINANGTSANPIRIQAANRGGATLRSNLTVVGHHVQVIGLAFVGAGVALRRDNCRVTRCKFTNYSVPISARGAADALITYNEFSGWTFRAIEIDPIYEGRSGHNPRIRYNYLSNPSSSADFGIGIGQQPSHTDRNVNAIVEYNLFERCNIDQNIVVKCSNNKVRYNTLINCGAILIRHGKNNLYLGNHMESTKGIWVHDIGNEVRDNYLNNSDISVFAGNITSNQMQGQVGGHPRAENTRVLSNFARQIQVGRTFSNWSQTHPAIHTLVDGNRGSMVYNAHQNTTVRNANASSAGNGAQRTSRNQVGVNG